METVRTALQRIFDHLAALLIDPASQYSLTSLACALIVAVALLLARRRGGRRLPPRVLLRALLPRRFLRHPSSAIDLGYFLFNTFVFAGIFGAALVSYSFLTRAIIGALEAVFGQIAPVLPDVAARAAITILLFLGYELGYWLDHCLKHRVPFLWELHKVHHSAEVLTPLTAARMHPLDTVIFVNILAITAAIAGGLGSYLVGAAAPYALSGNNILLVLFIHAYVHLQHTEVWLAFRGPWGRIFLSPAHHQIHHSADAAHFNTNFGSCLAVWDWLFGTLHIPERTRERLNFGVEAYEGKHTLTGEALAPVARSAQSLFSILARFNRRAAARPAAEGPRSRPGHLPAGGANWHSRRAGF